MYSKKYVTAPTFHHISFLFTLLYPSVRSVWIPINLMINHIKACDTKGDSYYGGCTHRIWFILLKYFCATFIPDFLCAQLYILYRAYMKGPKQNNIYATLFCAFRRNCFFRTLN